MNEKREFKMTPGVESTIQRQAELRAVEDEARQAIYEILDSMLGNHPGCEKVFARILEGAQSKLMDAYERRRREERRAGG